MNNKMTGFILTGFCALLFGGAQPVPPANPNLLSLLRTARAYSVSSALLLDQINLRLDGQRALARLANGQEQIKEEQKRIG